MGVKLITGLMGGLALFLYGMKVMSDALSTMTGNKLEGIIDRITHSKLRAWLFGTSITALIQSSSATTVLTVGLVNSGIMKLRQAVGIIIGANLGTTATAWILSLNGIEGATPLLMLMKPSTFAPLMAIIGAFMLMFAKSDKVNKTATIITGFSIMMIGMTFMGSSVEPLRDNEGFKNMMTTLHNPLLGYVFAILVTMVIQSSDATVGILEALSISVGIDAATAIPIICGAQVGTCITALVSAVETNNNGKRAAFIHLYYNLAKTIPLLVIIYTIKAVFDPPFFYSQAGVLWIILFHTGINVLGSVFYLPFSNILLKLAELTVPFSEEEKKEEALKILDPRFLKNPGYALEQAKKATMFLCNTVAEGCDTLSESSYAWNKKAEEKVMAVCERVESYKNQTVKYLNLIQKTNKSDKDASETTLLISTCVYFRDIGQRLANIVMIFKRYDLEHLRFSQEASDDLRLYGCAIKELMEILETEVYKQSVNLPHTVHIYTEMLADFYSQIKLRQIKRLNNNISNPRSNEVFSGVLFEMESMVDKCDVIARGFENALDFEDTLTREEKAEKDRIIRRLFEDKYGRLSSFDIYQDIELKREENK
ncbi:MAG: Na/Pi cotransporter family protein [Lachnospiraceae bacterium]|nr:Na/Pi cotransporter family protein [Lachnospiraceae bacterium]